MSVPSNTPQIAALKLAVEKKAETTMRTHEDFLILVGKIECNSREHISESTLERIWGYSTREAAAISLHTLNVLSRYAGAASWEEFCKHLKESACIESEELTRNSILSSNLPESCTIRLGWLPDRIIEAEFKGDAEFVVKTSLNSSIKPGDRFKCLQFQKGEPLFLDCFRRVGEKKEHRYVVGERNGLTLVEIIPREA